MLLGVHKESEKGGLGRVISNPPGVLITKKPPQEFWIPQAYGGSRQFPNFKASCATDYTQDLGTQISGILEERMIQSHDQSLRKRDFS